MIMCSRLWRTFWQLGPHLMQGDLLERQSAPKSQQSRKNTRRGLPWQGGERLRWIIKGVEELRPASSFHQKRAPVTISMLTDLNSSLSRMSGLDVCVRAICLLSFFCQLCSGELLPPTEDLAKFKPHRHATFSHIARTLHSPTIPGEFLIHSWFVPKVLVDSQSIPSIPITFPGVLV